MQFLHHCTVPSFRSAGLVEAWLGMDSPDFEAHSFRRVWAYTTHCTKVARRKCTQYTGNTRTIVFHQARGKGVIHTTGAGTEAIYK